MYAIEAAAESLGVQVIAAPVRATADIEPALESFGRQPNGGLILTSDPFTNLRYSLIANLAGRHSLPSIASEASLTRLHQLDAIFTIFGASDRDKRLILQGRGLRKRL